MKIFISKIKDIKILSPKDQSPLLMMFTSLPKSTKVKLQKHKHPDYILMITIKFNNHKILKIIVSFRLNRR